PRPRSAQADGRRKRRYGLDVERDREAQGRMEPGNRCRRERARIPTQPRDLRTAAAAAGRPPVRQYRSNHWPGRLVRPARPGREGAARGGRRDLPRLRRADTAAGPRATAEDSRLRRRVSAALMTSLPGQPSEKKLGLVIDLDICVGCHACAVNCKEWNTGGHMAPLSDREPYGADPLGVWFNRVHTYEVGEGGEGRTVPFPRSCLHFEHPPCVQGF